MAWEWRLLFQRDQPEISSGSERIAASTPPRAIQFPWHQFTRVDIDLDRLGHVAQWEHRPVCDGSTNALGIEEETGLQGRRDEEIDRSCKSRVVTTTSTS